jgi:hypothetical protein
MWELVKADVDFESVEMRAKKSNLWEVELEIVSNHFAMKKTRIQKTKKTRRPNL